MDCPRNSKLTFRKMHQRQAQNPRWRPQKHLKCSQMPECWTHYSNHLHKYCAMCHD